MEPCPTFQSSSFCPWVSHRMFLQEVPHPCRRWSTSRSTKTCPSRSSICHRIVHASQKMGTNWRQTMSDIFPTGRNLIPRKVLRKGTFIHYAKEKWEFLDPFPLLHGSYGRNILRDLDSQSLLTLFMNIPKYYIPWEILLALQLIRPTYIHIFYPWRHYINTVLWTSENVWRNN